jgi:tetratricopeptide (TPR) repeat protein
MLSFSKQDTISWEIEPTLSDKKIVKEASEYAATMPVNYLLPHWREVSRFYFDGGNVRMRDAGVYVRENNWDSAFELWKQIYDKGKGRQKMRAAFNIGLYYEMKDNPATAIEWVEKADKLAKAGTTEATVIAFYLLKLKERQVQLPQLNIQMNRFKDNF